MKSLDERLETRKNEYEELIKAEHLVESYLERILPLFPENSKCSGTIYNHHAFLYISVNSVEDFEENIISKLSEEFNITWKRTVAEESISHYTSLMIGEEYYQIYITVVSKPTDLCRIIAVPTGKIKKIQKYAIVDEAEIEYVIECSDEIE